MTEDKSKDIIEECTCDAPKTEAKVETPKVETPAPAQEQVPAWASSIVSSVSGLTEKLAALEQQAGVRAAPKPEAQVATENKTISIGQIAEKMREAFDDGKSFNVTLPYDQVRNFAVAMAKGPNGQVQESMRSSYDRKFQIKEAYTLSGTHTAIDQNNTVQTVPGGNDWTPFRQFTQYKQVPKGKDSETFYKTTLPNVVSQSVGTTATESSMTMTAVNVAPSTISGVYFKVSNKDEEDVPYDLAGTIVEKISEVVVDFENNDILNTVSAQGTLTPELWLNGNSGATITHSDIASMTLDPASVGKGMAYLRKKGYLKYGKPIFAVHPDSLDALTRDSDLTNYVQFGNPSITQTGPMAELYGATIIPTQSVEAYDNTTNDVYHNLLFMPGLSYGAASKRDVSIKFHEVAEDNQIRVTANWRFKSGVIDADSIVRISTAQ